MNYKMKYACTGHGIERLRGKEQEVREWLRKQIVDENGFYGVDEDDVLLICGGAEGTDELFGSLALDYPKMGLALYLPFHLYRVGEMMDLRNRMNEMYWVSEVWRRGVDRKRDRMMVNDCDVLLAVWDGIKKGGTWETIKYAMKKGKPIIFFPMEILYNEYAAAESK